MSTTKTVADAAGKAVATQATSPLGMIKAHSRDFQLVLPSHIKTDHWVRLAQSALKRGRKITDRKSGNFGQYELEVAARNNPLALLAALLDAARLGLEPGSDQYYLTPRREKQANGSMRLQIMGIVGYQGYVELMYRSGAISSVVVEVVRKHDEYEFVRGRDEIPTHRFPKFASREERGDLIGVYAYARMHDGGYSRVVELSRDDIEEIKRSSASAGSDSSPWHTHPQAMWLKSAVRQLRKWVPTSAEFLREQLRAQAEAQRITQERGLPEALVEDTDVLDGEVISDTDDAQPATVAETTDKTGTPAATAGASVGDEGWGEAVKPGEGKPRGDG